MAQQDVTVCIDAYPPPDTTIFRIAAADDILRLVADVHDAMRSVGRNETGRLTILLHEIANGIVEAADSRSSQPQRIAHSVSP